MYYLGIDLGGTNIAAGIVDENYKIIKKKSTPTLAHRDGKEIIKVAFSSFALLLLFSSLFFPL